MQQKKEKKIISTWVFFHCKVIALQFSLLLLFYVSPHSLVKKKKKKKKLRKSFSNHVGFRYSHGHQSPQTSPFNANVAPAMSCKSFCNFSENRVHIIWKGRLAISRTSIPAIRKDQETFLDRIRILRSVGKRLYPQKVILSPSAFLFLSP